MKVTRRETVLDGDILPLDVAELAQALAEGRVAGRIGAWLLGAIEVVFGSWAPLHEQRTKATLNAAHGRRDSAASADVSRPTADDRPTDWGSGERVREEVRWWEADG